MTINVDFEFLSPLTCEIEDARLEFQEFQWDLVESPPSTKVPESATDVSQNDLGYFMTLAGRHELLSAEEERRLGRDLWTGRRRLLRILRRARQGSRQFPPIHANPPSRPVTASTRRRLARVEKRARELLEALRAETPHRLPTGYTKSRLQSVGAQLEETLSEMDETRRELVERNLRLVVWVAKSFRGRGFDFIDVIQEGNLGLMRAVDRFDPAVGARFSTFATHWIQQGIRRALAEKARTIRIPVNRIPEVRQTLHARAKLGEKLGRAARPEEIASEIGMPRHKVEELLPAIAPIDSIDAPIGATDRKLGDTLEDRSGRSPLERALEDDTKRAVCAVLQRLPDRQRVILSMRHGIGYPRECTLEEIGEALGLSRERIRQVEKVAVASVRDWLRDNQPQLAQPV